MYFGTHLFQTFQFKKHLSVELLPETTKLC